MNTAGVNFIQIRTSNLSDEQKEREARYWRAVELLEANGFEVNFIQSVVSRPDDDPGYIIVR